MDIQKATDQKEPERVNIPNRYLNSNYYIVQPPLIAKTFQAVFTKGLQSVYEHRRNKHSALK